MDHFPEKGNQRPPRTPSKVFRKKKPRASRKCPIEVDVDRLHVARIWLEMQREQPSGTLPKAGHEELGGAPDQAAPRVFSFFRYPQPSLRSPDFNLCNTSLDWRSTPAWLQNRTRHTQTCDADPANSGDAEFKDSVHGEGKVQTGQVMSSAIQLASMNPQGQAHCPAANKAPHLTVGGTWNGGWHLPIADSLV